MFIKNNELGSKIQVLFAFSCEKVDSGLKYGRRWKRNLTCDKVVAFPAWSTLTRPNPRNIQRKLEIIKLYNGKLLHIENSGNEVTSVSCTHSNKKM